MPKWILIFIVIPFCISCVTAWTQENGQVTVQLSDEYLTEWLLLGPFDGTDLEQDYLASVGGEANIQPKEADTITTTDGKTLTWKRYASSTDTVNLTAGIGSHENVMAYAVCNIISPKTQTLEARLQSNDYVKMWFNGQQVHANLTTHGGDLDLFPVTLKAGINHCLLKVGQVQAGGYWNFSLQLWDEAAYHRAIKLEVKAPKQFDFKTRQLKLAINAQRVPESIMFRLPPFPVTLELRNSAGKLLLKDTRPEGEPLVWNVPDDFEGDVQIVARQTDVSGKVRQAELSVSTRKLVREKTGDLRKGIPRPVEQPAIKLSPNETISIMGTLLAFDNVTPHSGVFVQAIQDGQVVAYTFSDDAGRYRFVNLKPGRYQVRCQIPGGYISPISLLPLGEGLGVRVQRGKTISGVDFRFAPFKKGTWRRFSSLNGLAENHAHVIYRDSRGYLWFGTRNGVSRYDGKEFVNYTTEDGLVGNWVTDIHEDRQGNLWFGSLGVSCYGGKEFVNYTTEDGLVSNWVFAIHEDRQGNLWFRTNDGVSRYDGKTFVNYTQKDGLLYNRVSAIYEDQRGELWFGGGHLTYGGGLSHYDGKIFVNYTQGDGLADVRVNAIGEDRHGTPWFGGGSFTIFAGGVSRFDPVGLVNFTTADGLPHNFVNAVHQDKQGILWFGTNGGVSRYDGKRFINYTTDDGLGSNIVYTIHEDRYGNLWFARGESPVGGVSHFDGRGFVNFTTQDGLVSNYIEAIHEDQQGNFWFAGGGASRYDGKVFVNYTEKIGLPGLIHSIYEDGQGYLWFGASGRIFRYDGNEFVKYTLQDGLEYVPSIYEDQQGYLWFGTYERGLLRYDGKEFVNYTEKDGLPCNRLWWGIHEDSHGHLWFGTVGGGVAQYDGVAFQSLDVRDGLGGNTVYGICEDSDGYLWFGTDGGATRYQRDKIPPIAKIVSVKTDKTYTDLDTIPSFTAGTRVTIEYSSIDFKTHPDKRLYRYQMKGHDENWSRATRETQVDYSNLKSGQYTFVAQAIDRDLNYSEPVNLTLKFVPPFYMSAGFLVPTLGFGTILIVVLTIVSIGYVKRRRQVQAYQQAAVRELQDAQQVQMSLMPDAAPPIEGVEIAGKCIPANTVSGDFFDYLVGKGDNEIGLVVADVCGKAMKGAMNAVMTDGILHSVAKDREKLSPASLMVELNDVLKARMESEMNVTMVIGVIHRNRCERSEAIPKNSVSEQQTTLTLANAAHHAHPLLLRRPPAPASGSKGEIQTLKMGGLPLGMRAGVRYSEEQFQLQSGDVVIFMTDGIIEAQDSEEQLYSDSGRLEKTISQFTLDLSAEAMVEAVINDAMNFGGDKSARDDDMTVVVAKIE